MADPIKAIPEMHSQQSLLLNQNPASKSFYASKVQSTNNMLDDSLLAQEKFQFTQNQFFINNQDLNQPNKNVSPLLPEQLLKIQENDLQLGKVIATSGEVLRMGNSQQRSKPRKNQNSNGDSSKSHIRVASNPSKPTSEGVQNTPNQATQDQFQAFSMFHPAQINAQAPYTTYSQQPVMMQQQPQVHFIAKQQKFYQISPSRGAEVIGLQAGQMPIMLDKRPYTSSSIQQVMSKRASGNKVQNNAIAALYLANSKNNQSAANTKPQQQFDTQGSQMMQGTPYQPPKKRTSQNLSVPRKNQPPVFSQQDHEQLFEESIKLRQQNYDLREENGRCKARIKMQETEIQRKDKALEDFYQQNSFLQNAQQKGTQLAPIAQQTQKYQQETFLLMSLKKQVKQLKAELQKREEQVQSLLKVGKVARYSELEQELEIYKEEVARLQQLEGGHPVTEQQQLSKSESNQAQLIVQGRNTDSTEQIRHDELMQQLKQAQLREQAIETQLKESEAQVKQLNIRLGQHSDSFERTISEKDHQIQQLEKKNQILKETIEKVGEGSTQATQQVDTELKFVAPILGFSSKITDRLIMAQELKQGVDVYKPSVEVQNYLKQAQVYEIALRLPVFKKVPKFKIDQYKGELNQKIVCDFAEVTEKGERLGAEQQKALMARYLVEIVGTEVYCNTERLVAEEHQNEKGAAARKAVSEEEMLDIAEMCFVKVADELIKQGCTVRESFGKYAIPEMLPESKTVLDLLVPEAFFECIKVDLKLKDFSDLEAACLMRVLAKPELDNAIILNEFALILENFGVPLIDATISDDEDYIPAGQEKPHGYDLNEIDEEGFLLLRDLARFLLREYMHPREFFGKMVKANQEIKSDKRVFRLDLLSVKDFYLKIKIANIRKNLQENQSLNRVLCLDPQLHPHYFNMRTFVRALEEIAEVEQDKLVEQERAAEEAQNNKKSKPQAVMTSALSVGEKSTENQQEVVVEYQNFQKLNVDVKPEQPSFGKGKRSRRSPKPQSKFQALGTIDEAQNETTTSYQFEVSVKDDESKVGSNLRDSNRIEIDESGGLSNHKESMQRVDLLNISLSGRDDKAPQNAVRSLRSDQPQHASSEHLLGGHSAHSDIMNNVPAQETEEDDDYDE